MGRSSASCFRMITCGGDGGDPAGKDAGGHGSYENKSSSDKRRWSFRKKSARHRGSSNSMVLEIPATRARETLESALLKSPSPDDNHVPEKPLTVQSTGEKTQLPVPSAVQPTVEKPELAVPSSVQENKMQLPVQCVEEEADEKTGLPVPVESKGTETDDDVNRTEKETELQVNFKETDAGDAFVIEKDIDYKVDPRESVANDDLITIGKEDDEKPDDSVVIAIQAAVRGFLARRELLRRKKVVRLQAAVRGHLVRRHAVGSLRVVQAIVKMQVLVRARRALQSMEDGSRGSAISDKEIRVSKMNTSSAPVEKLIHNKFARHLMESTPKTEPIRIKCDSTKPSSAWNWLERWMSVSSAEKTSKPDLSEEEQEKEKTENVASPAEVSSHDSVPLELYDTENVSKSDVLEASVEVDSHLNQPHPPAANELGSLSKETESVNELPKNSLKRKASNPSFLAAQSKFEELTLSAGSNEPMPLSYNDVDVGESKTDKTSSEADIAETPKKLSLAEDDARGVRPELGGSECGTEISISSTLDTPDKRSEVEAAEEPKNRAALPEQGTCGTDKAEKMNIDIKDTTLLDSVEDSHIEVDHVKNEVEIVSETKQKPETSTPDAKKKHPETETGNRAYAFSPEASSPRTVPESQATPASQASSVKAKKDRTEKSSLSQKRKLSKKTTSNPKLDSGGSGAEQEAGKDHKSGKRRNSFGFDQEPRDSSSGGSSSLPRFMQPTESARAKVQENNSPRSSPDVQERDPSLKKRHSLPGANGKQGSSPRIQRSTSQAQQATKERKWQR